MNQQAVPYDTEAERATLGSILIDPQCFHQLRNLVATEYFYDRKHRFIWDAFLGLDRKHEPIDFQTVTGELRRQQHLDAAGGAAYISTLINSVASAVNVDAYAGTVKDMYIRRKLLQEASHMAQLAHDLEKAPGDAITDIEAALFRLHDTAVRAEQRPVKFDVLADDVFERLRHAHESTEPLAIPTGYQDIDAKLSGFAKTSFYVVAARPGIGKSALLGNFAFKIASQGWHVAVFNLEMSNRQFFHRLLVMQGYGRLSDLENGTLSDDSWAHITDGIGRHAELPIWSDEQQALAVPELRAKAIRLASQYGLDALFVDYAQLMRPVERWGSRQQQLGEITRGLKGLAKELNIPVIAAAQLGRQAENQRPQLNHLREAGDFENDADAVLFIHRDRHGDVDPRTHVAPTELIIAKHRHGQTGSVNLGWVPHRVAFVPTKAN